MEDAVKWWIQLCDTVSAMGLVSPEAAPYSVEHAEVMKIKLDSLQGRIRELAAAAKRFIETARCEDCGGTGIIGTAKSGKYISCESCHGHEDRIGDGYILKNADGLLEWLISLAAKAPPKEETNNA